MWYVLVWYYISHYKIQYHFRIIYEDDYKNLLYCKIKELLAQFQYIRDELKDENEIAIAEKYNYNARRYTTVLTSISQKNIVVMQDVI